MKNVATGLKERYKYSQILLKELVKTDFKLRYQGSWLGIAWSVVKPLMLFAVMYMVFAKFLRFTDGTTTYPVVLLLGISLWQFFTDGTMMGMTAIVSRGDLLRKINFPKYIMVLSTSAGALISLAINLVVVLVFSLFLGVNFTWRVVLIPIFLIEYFMLVTGISFILCTMFVWFRDIQHIWEVVTQALFYATPIIYPITMVSGMYPAVAKLMLLNPAAQIIQDIRKCLIAPDTTITTWSSFDAWYISIIPALLTVLIFVFGIYTFRKNSSKFAEIM